MTGLLILLLASQALSAQSSAARKPEREKPDAFGWHVARLNDVDGDKCADFALDDRKNSVWVVSGKTGEVIARLHFEPWITIGTLGHDLDGDGAFDLTSRETSKPGGLCIRSGRTLEVIRRLEPKDASTGLRLGPIAVGDRDGDGVPDVVAAEVRRDRGCLLVFSGKTGQDLERIPGLEGCWFPDLACSDIDKDGRCEIAVTKSRTIWSILNPEDRTEVHMFSHDSPARLGSIVDKAHRLHYGPLLFVPDVDEDGRQDLLVAQLDACTNSEIAAVSTAGGSHKDATCLAVYSSATFSVCRVLEVPTYECVDGAACAILPDLDGDQVAEVGVAFDCSMVGYAKIYSGKTGRVLRTHGSERMADGVENLPNPGHFAVSMFGLGDTDGDGIGDYAIGSSGGADGLGVGCVSLYSGKSGRLVRVIWKRDLLGK